MKLDTTASKIEIALVIAANNTMAKNKAPITFPTAPICAKTLGRETNIRLGPDASIPSRPIKENTAGIIITPAKIATPVSKISIWLMDFTRFASSFTYEPYATIIPIATLRLKNNCPIASTKTVKNFPKVSPDKSGMR